MTSFEPPAHLTTNIRAEVEEPSTLLDEFDGRLEEAEARRMER